MSYYKDDQYIVEAIWFYRRRVPGLMARYYSRKVTRKLCTFELTL